MPYVKSIKAPPGLARILGVEMFAVKVDRLEDLRRFCQAFAPPKERP